MKKNFQTPTGSFGSGNPEIRFLDFLVFRIPEKNPEKCTVPIKLGSNVTSVIEKAVWFYCYKMDMVTVTGAFSLWIFTAAKNHEIASHISEVQSDLKQKW